MRLEYENRCFRVVLEVSAGSGTTRQVARKYQAPRRAEHELRRELFRRTVNELKEVQPVSEE